MMQAMTRENDTLPGGTEPSVDVKAVGQSTNTHTGPASDAAYVEIISGGIDKRLKIYNVCCSQGGCK